MKDRAAEVVFYEWGISRWITSRTRMALDCAGRSIYRELLDLCYAQGSIPKDPVVLMRHCGATKEEWDRTWPVISHHFRSDKHDSGALLNDQASVFRKNYFDYCQEQREKGKKGGRPKSNKENGIKTNGLLAALENEKPNETQYELTNDELIRTNETKTNERTVARELTPGSEFPETAAAVRGYFPSADDAIVTVIANESVRAYVDAVNGHGKSPPLTDAIIAEAVHEAHFKKQTSPALFREKVPRVVKSWAEEAIRKGQIR